MKIRNRAISLLLVLVMLMGIVPINALADTYNFKVTVFGTLKVYLYNDFDDAWDKVTDNGGTLEVRTDVKLSGMKEVPKDIVVTVIATGMTLNRGLSEDNSKNSDSTLITGNTSFYHGGASFYGASLVYRDRIAVRYYFTGNVTGCTFTANGNTYTPVAKDGMYYIEITDILPQDLDQQITLTVTDSDGNTLSVSYGPMNYIVRMSQKGNDTLASLLKALYNYHLAAKAL